MKVYVTKVMYVEKLKKMPFADSGDSVAIVTENGDAFTERGYVTTLLTADIRKITDVATEIDLAVSSAEKMLVANEIVTKLYTRLLSFHHFGKSDIAPILGTSKEEAREIIEHLMKEGLVTRGRSMFHLTDEGKRVMSDFIGGNSGAKSKKEMGDDTTNKTEGAKEGKSKTKKSATKRPSK